MKDLKLSLCVGCDQLYLLRNQNTGFFDYQYLRKESIDTLDFLHGDSRQC